MSSTFLHRLKAWGDTDPNAVAQSYKKDGKWNPISAREFCDRVYWLALFFESKGMTAEDVGTILSYNCPEWVHVELAALLLGAKSAGLYPNSTSKDINYILNHTESRFLSIQNKDYFKKIVNEGGSSSLPDRVQLILNFEGDASYSPKAITYEAALLQGQRLALSKGTKKMGDYLDKIDPKAGAYIIYTSGTTGSPKGAVLSHHNLAYTVDLIIKTWGLPEGKGGTLFSFLPLCHIAEKIQNLGAGITLRYGVSFCSKFENVSSELPEVQPGLLLCVPRVWEKMMEGVFKKVEDSKPAKKKLVHWAFKVGARMAEIRFTGKLPGIQDFFQWQLADKLVLSKIRQALGLGKAEALASGAAALAPHICKWFQSLGLEIQEAYGQTESSGVICLTVRGMDCAGTVGKPPTGLDVKLAADGEILSRGENVFLGYFRDEKSTQQTLIDGWLHTGDLAEYDSRGLMKIKGRKKEILKTSGGKMIAPVPIEETLKAASMISQVCMVGDGRKYVSALITLSEGKMGEIQDKKMGDSPVITTPKVVKEVKEIIDEVNASLASYEQIKKFAILSREFSVADGEMTPTLKMKRNVIESHYREIIDKLYETA
jgi:long-chain acyl-CoA synthetase